MRVHRSTVTLYARPGCHLCDEARDVILAIEEADLREVDIERDDRLLARFLERIPVVEIGGEIVSELEPDGDAIRAAVHTVGR
jgi:glutaredoxin